MVTKYGKLQVALSYHSIWLERLDDSVRGPKYHSTKVNCNNDQNNTLKANGSML